MKRRRSYTSSPKVAILAIAGLTLVVFLVTAVGVQLEQSESTPTPTPPPQVVPSPRPPTPALKPARSIEEQQAEFFATRPRQRARYNSNQTTATAPTADQVARAADQCIASANARNMPFDAKRVDFISSCQRNAIGSTKLRLFCESRSLRYYERGQRWGCE